MISMPLEAKRLRLDHLPCSAATEFVVAQEKNLIHGRQRHIRFRRQNAAMSWLVAISMPMSRIGKWAPGALRTILRHKGPCIIIVAALQTGLEGP